MVSRRNYFAITVVMFIVFFLFQFTNVVLESWNGYEKNSYVRKKEELASQGSAYDAEQQKTEALTENAREKIIYIGNADAAAGKVVYSWVNYTKRVLDVYDTLEKYMEADEQNVPKIIVIDAARVDWEQENTCDVLKSYVEQGSNLVFSSLPGADEINNNVKLRNLLGIKQVKAEKTTVEGIHLHDGFLLGGEAVYQSEDEEENEKRQDMDLSFPWYVLSLNTEAYMSGMPAEETDEEEYPAVIWKKSYEKADVFAVNGNYMEDVTGLGLLSAVSAKSKEYEVYPIVNAQNMVITNYPGLAPENDEVTQKQYGQSMSEVSRNIMWPSLVSVYRRNTLGLTCMLTPRYDYNQDAFPSQTELEFYMKRLKEQNAEAGLSGESVSDTLISQKLDEDERFIKETLPDYQFTSFYAGKLTEAELDSVLQDDMMEALRTVVADYDESSEVIGYRSDYVTRQNILSDGTEHTYRTDLRLRAVETALGYSSVRMDLSRAAYPENDEDEVEKLFSEFSTNINTFWQNFHMFDGTTVSECDQRIRNFLALDYEEKRNGGTIQLDITGAVTPAWFVLRTEEDAVSSVDGGTFLKLEEGIYLIEAESTRVTIEF